MFRFYKTIQDTKFYFTGSFGRDTICVSQALHVNPCESNYRLFILLHQHGYAGRQNAGKESPD